MTGRDRDGTTSTTTQFATTTPQNKIQVEWNYFYEFLNKGKILNKNWRIYLIVIKVQRCHILSDSSIDLIHLIPQSNQHQIKSNQQQIYKI